jgi:hypothetical protein
MRMNWVKIVMFSALLAVLSGCGGSRAWTRGDVAREAAYVAVTTIDWRQTREIAEHPDRYYEMNPILGKHPSVGRVNTYFLVTAVGHVLITHAVPHPYRPYWQYISIGASAACVINNQSIGLKIEW